MKFASIMNFFLKREQIYWIKNIHTLTSTISFGDSDNNWWPFWAHFNWACLVQPLDSATKITMRQSLRSWAQHWSEGPHYWFEQVKKYTWSHFKAVTGPKINCTNNFLIMAVTQLYHALYTTNYHLLLRRNWSGWSRVNQKTPKGKSAMN